MKNPVPLTKLNAIAVKVASELLEKKTVVRATSALTTDSENMPSIELQIIVAKPFRYVGATMAEIAIEIRKQAEKLKIDRNIYTHFIRQEDLEDA
jgi:hypothetical protein